MKVSLLLSLLLFSCGGTSKVDEPLALKTECYIGNSEVMSPDGQPIGASKAMVLRTLDPAAFTITEVVQSAGENGPEVHLVEMKVAGNSVAFQADGYKGTGTLYGKKWEWTAWKTVSNFEDGTRVESTDTLKNGVLSVEKNVFQNGKQVVRMIERYESRPVSECENL